MFYYKAKHGIMKNKIGNTKKSRILLENTATPIDLEEDNVLIFEIPSGKATYANKSALDLVKLSQKKLSLKSYNDIIASPGWESIQKSIKNKSNLSIGIELINAEVPQNSGEKFHADAKIILSSSGNNCSVAIQFPSKFGKSKSSILSESILKASMDGFALINAEGRIIDTNQAYCDMIGYSREELLKLHLNDLDTIESPEEIMRHIKMIHEEGLHRFDTKHRRKDGKIIDIEVSAKLIDIEKGLIFAFFQDISNRIQAEMDRFSHIRYLENMNQINQIINRSIDLDQMLSDLLDSILSIFDCDRAFLLYPCDPDSPSWSVPMERTKPEYPGVLAMQQEMPMIPGVAKNFRLALDSPDPLVIDIHSESKIDEEHIQLSIKAQLLMAIYPKVDKPWAFGIHHCRDEHIWTGDEIWLFQEIGNRLADTLNSYLIMCNLQNSEEKYRKLFETMTQGVVYQDADGNIISANQSALKILGLTEDQMMERTSMDPRWKAIHEDGSKFKGESHPAMLALKSGKVVTGEIMGVLNFEDDAYRWIEISSIPQFRADEKRPHQVITTFTDITERKKVENALLKSDEELAQTNRMLQNVLDNIPVRVFWKDKELNYLGCNIHFAKDAGLNSPDELIGENDYIMGWKDQAELYRADDRQVIDSGISKLNYEEPQTTPAGDQIWLRTSKVPLTNMNNEITGILGTYEDITEKKVADKALNNQMQLNEQILQSTMDGFILADSSGRIIETNPAYCKMVGYSREEILTLNIRELEDEIKDSNVEKKIQSIIRKGADNFETRHKHKDGRSIDIEVSIIIMQQDDEPLLAAFVRDITERKRGAETLARAQRLEIAGRVAGQVAHDFNNLLGPLTAYPELIRSETEPSSFIWQYTEEMEKAANKMSEINQQLLTLGRRGHYNLEPMSLNETVTEAVDQIYPFPSFLTIEMNLSGNIETISGGKSQIYRALVNLIENARDAMRNEGRIFITTQNLLVQSQCGNLASVSTGKYVRLTIADTGQGMTEDIMARIFDPFFTTKSTDKKRGSGLGLSVVHSVMEDHNGYVDCTSKIGVGTEFHLYFPTSSKPLDKPHEEQLKTGNEKILVIDDDEFQRNVACHLLEKLGYEVQIASSGEQALKILKNMKFDLLLIDMVMPGGLNGTETFRKALVIYPSQKAIIMSGYAESDSVEMAINLGAGGFIRKPLTIKSIANAVREELDKK
jgi:PAS domain S-box-containing protein